MDDNNQWTEIGPQTQAPKWQSTSDQRSVFLASTCCRQHHPSASGLPALSTSRYFIFTLNFSLFFSLTCTCYWICVNGFLSVSVSLSLSKEWKWNEMRLSLCLSLFKTLSNSLFLFELWLANSFCLTLLYNFINICPCFWLYPLVLVRYN